MTARLVVFAAALIAAPVATQRGPDVRLAWAIAARHAKEVDLMPVRANVTLRTGDELQIVVSPLTRCFVYVLLHDSQNAINLLFPSSFAQFDRDYQSGVAYYVPPSAPGHDEWFKLDQHVGRESIHLIAAAERLTDFENQLTTYATQPAAQKGRLVGGILDQIRQLKLRMPLNTDAERPAAIGGTVRGLGGTDIAKFAIETSATSLFVRTIVIDHQ